MKQATTIKLLTFSIAGLFAGFFIGRTDIFTIFSLAAGTGLVIVIYITGKAVAFFMENKKPAVINYIGFVALTLIISLLTSIVTMSNIINRKQKMAEDLIPKIEQYRQHHSQYPQTLNDLAINNSETFTYWTDSARQTFSLRFIRDGWHFSEYDSKNKEWISGD